MYSLGDIKINGKDYRIDLDSYRVKDLADFSPRTSVPGGSIIMSELLLYQTLVMTDWRHGFGFMWHTDAMGYMNTEGNVETRFAGIAMISTELKFHLDSDDSVKRGFVEWNGSLYSWSDTGLRKMDFVNYTWTNVYAGSINFAFPTENYLFFCPTNGRIKKINKSDVISDAGINANSIDYAWMAIHRGFIYAGKRNKNEVYYANEEDLSDLHGNPNDDPNMIPIGAGGYSTLGAITFAGYFYVFRKDGIWAIGEDRIARMVLDFSTEKLDSNFKARTIFNGYLYFNIGSKIYQWNGSRIIDHTPPRMNDTFPYNEIISYGQMTTVKNFLYVTAKYKKEDNFEVGLFSFDGVGWHKLNNLNTPEGADVGALYFAPVQNKLYSTWESSLPIIFELKMGTGFLPYNQFATGIGHRLYTPRLDMGFRRIRKSTPSILVEASNLASDRYIDIYYSIDGGNYLLWGRVQNNGITELTNPSGLSTIEYNYLNLAVTFITNNPEQTPILEGITVRFLLRPDVFYGYNFNIIAADNYIYGNRQDNRSPYEILEELKVARDSKRPIEFVDIFNGVHYGYISSLTILAAERHEISEDGKPNIESRINVNFVEAR